MKAESRRWFDCGYKFTRGYLPFGTITGETTIDELKIAIGDKHPEDFLQKVLEISKAFYEKIPTEKDFFEEKERLVPIISSGIRRAVSSASHAYSIGSIVGDVDISLIGKVRDIRAQLGNLLKEGFAKKYPILDFNALYFLSSGDDNQLVQKLLNSRMLANGSNKITREDRLYVAHTLKNAKELW